jgi:hypothetical protein
MPWLVRARAVRVSAAACGVAALLLAWTLWRVTRVEPPPAIALPPVDPAAATRPPWVAAYGLERVLTAVGKDPFHPARHRPGQRFHAPADQAVLAARHADQQTSANAVRLIGTAAGTNGGGFAMCTWQGNTPRIVRVGEQLGGWTLKKVTPGTAEFATPRGTVLVRVAKVGGGT